VINKQNYNLFIENEPVPVAPILNSDVHQIPSQISSHLYQSRQHLQFVEQQQKCLRTRRRRNDDYATVSRGHPCEGYIYQIRIILCSSLGLDLVFWYCGLSTRDSPYTNRNIIEKQNKKNTSKMHKQ
jgi:hypothetical protein